jgi:probable addiction module antidote protein
MKQKTSISHHDAVVRELRHDPELTVEYLNAALEDSQEPRVLLIALRHVVQAYGVAKMAKAAAIERESLYRALSERGNPRWSTLAALLKVLGVRLTVEPAQTRRKRRAA